MLVIALLCMDAKAETYQLDDGYQGYALGFSPNPPRPIAFMNSFQIRPAGETLTSVDIAFLPVSGGPSDVASEYLICVWIDPSNDGNPDDAVLTRTVELTRPSPSPFGFKNVQIDPLTVSTDDWFFVGAFWAPSQGQHFSSSYIAIDNLRPHVPDRSFIAVWDAGTAGDPGEMSSATFLPVELGNHFIRANAVPEPNAIGWVFSCLATYYSRRPVRSRPLKLPSSHSARTPGGDDQMGRAKGLPFALDFV